MKSRIRSWLSGDTSPGGASSGALPDLSCCTSASRYNDSGKWDHAGRVWRRPFPAINRGAVPELSLTQPSYAAATMPIYECDPWREQYFTDVSCPSDVHIPTDDMDGYKFNPRHRWIYNRLRVAQSQGLECGLSDSAPPRYPVFCKPVTNLKGMGAG